MIFSILFGLAAEKSTKMACEWNARGNRGIADAIKQGDSVLGGKNRESSATRSLGTLLRCAVASVLLISLVLAAPSAVQRVSATEPFRLFRINRSSPSPYDQRQQIISDLPLDRLTSEAKQKILSIANSPTLYRRLPTQAIACDPEMFLFLTRKPEVMVGVWELMGITQVQTERLDPYHLSATDGSGTQCDVDLVYGDTSLHLYTAEGSYDGPMVAGKIRGRGVFVVRSSYATGSHGQTTVTGTIDCFVQIDNLGADLIARTLSGLIGRSADYNFVETARFMSQVSLASQQNTAAMIDVAKRISQVDENTRRDFIELIAAVASKPTAKVARELFDNEFDEGLDKEPASLLDTSETDGLRVSLEPETSPVLPTIEPRARTAISTGETFNR